MNNKIIEFIKNWILRSKNSSIGYSDVIIKSGHINYLLDENTFILCFSIRKDNSTFNPEFFDMRLEFSSKNDYKIIIESIELNIENMEILFQFQNNLNTYIKNLEE